VPDDPAGQADRDRGRRRLAVRRDGGREVDELTGGLIGAGGGIAPRDQQDRVAEPADETGAGLNAYAHRHSVIVAGKSLARSLARIRRYATRPVK